MTTLVILLIIGVVCGVRTLVDVLILGFGGGLLALSIVYFIIPMIQGGMR